MHEDTENQFSNLVGDMFVTSSAWKNSQGSTIGGIGILLSHKAANNLLFLQKISNRIMVAEFNSNSKSNRVL